MSEFKNYLLTAMILVTVVTLTLLTGAHQSKRVRQTGNSSSESMQEELSKDRSIKQIRITAQDIARLPSGKSYLVDLRQRGTIYHFDSTSRRIDFSRIRLRTATGEVVMKDWLEKLLPPAIAGRWRSGHMSLGTAKDFIGLNVHQPRPSGVIKYEYDPETDTYSCRGDADCEHMFEDGVCGEAAVCGDSIPNQPVCICAAA